MKLSPHAPHHKNHPENRTSPQDPLVPAAAVTRQLLFVAPGIPFPLSTLTKSPMENGNLITAPSNERPFDEGHTFLSLAPTCLHASLTDRALRPPRATAPAPKARPRRVPVPRTLAVPSRRVCPGHRAAGRPLRAPTWNRPRHRRTMCMKSSDKQLGPSSKRDYKNIPPNSLC